MTTNLSRRGLLTAATLLPFAASSSACAETSNQTDGGQNHSQRLGNSRILVAYFTRSGNTKVIAGTIERALNADVFEIRSQRPYPEDYEANVEQARQETLRQYEPPLAENIPNFAQYEVVYLGFPIWGGTVPPVIRSFLKAHAMTGKSLRPFITHGGYGIGDAAAILTAHAKSAAIAPPFIMEADQERRTMTQVKGWLGDIAEGGLN